MKDINSYFFRTQNKIQHPAADILDYFHLTVFPAVKDFQKDLQKNLRYFRKQHRGTWAAGRCIHLCVPVALGEAPAHHVGDSEGLDSQQVQDHGVCQPELGLQQRRLSLRKCENPSIDGVTGIQLDCIWVKCMLAAHHDHQHGYEQAAGRINSKPINTLSFASACFFFLSEECEKYVK